MEDKLFGKVLMVLALVSGIYGNYLQREQNSLAQQQLDAQIRANPSSDKGDVKQAPPSPAGGDSRMTGYILQYGSSVVLVFGLLVAIGAIQFREPDPKKLTIHYARYGIGNRWWEYRNVADIVRGYIKDHNSVDMIAGYQSFGDPFRGKPKYTRFKYSFGGVTRIVSLPDGERLVIPERTSQEIRPTPKLKILSAFYGTGPLNDVDVHKRLLENATDGLVIPVESHLLVERDPASHKPKRIRVTYSYGNDTVWEVLRPEGTRLILPEDFELMKRIENQHAQDIAAMREEHWQEMNMRVTELQAQITSLRASSSGAQ